MKHIVCPICGEGNASKVLYPATFDPTHVDFSPRKSPDGAHFRFIACLQCGLIYCDPVFDPEAIIRLYRDCDFIVEEQLDNMAKDYFDQFEKIIPKIQQGRLLEVGCANGFFLEKVMDQYSFQEVRGVEICTKAIEQASARLKDKIVNSPLTYDLFPDDYFDVVCCFQIFDHVIDPNEFLQIIYKCLKKGGILLAINHDIKSILPKILGNRSSTFDISHIYLWDKKTMAKILEMNHFKIDYIKNIANRYQLDHIVRMLPLNASLRKHLRSGLKWLKAANLSIKLPVENMVTVGIK